MHLYLKNLNLFISGTNGYLDKRRRAFPVGGQVSGGDVQEPRHDALERMWLHCDEA